MQIDDGVLREDGFLVHFPIPMKARAIFAKFELPGPPWEIPGAAHRS